MPTPTLDTLPDGSLVIEADTAAEALAEVGSRLGSDAEIVSADKVHRGGWKGFFARETVQLVARARPAAAAPTPHTELATDGVAAVLAAMTREAESQEATFGEVLRREFARTVDATPAPASAPAGVAPSSDDVPAAAPASPAPPGQALAREPRPAAPSVGWSTDELLDLRVPAVVVAACEGLDPTDDTAWVLAIAGMVGSWCRPLPQGNSILVGPRAHQLGRALDVKLVEPGEAVGRARSVALRTSGGPSGRGHLSQARGTRWGHLVAGGARWEGLLLDDVAAVSWVGDEALPLALEAASRLGLVLGYGLGAATGNRPVRATPMDVALTIRSLLPRPLA